jgi:hypothetical protein
MKLGKEVVSLGADLVDYQVKIEAYQADLANPSENRLTRAEEELVAALSKEVVFIFRAGRGKSVKRMRCISFVFLTGNVF